MTANTTRFLFTAFAAACSTLLLPGQMEKRWIGEFGFSTFELAAPQVGTLAPDLQLWDLHGRPRSLHLERGRTVVLIGGSYT
ncbi:MAG: hypothetical protein VYE77_06555 [Planctomycetota bacterium]|nr:hypothetical protein [Planctomycetota bacterium]